MSITSNIQGDLFIRNNQYVSGDLTTRGDINAGGNLIIDGNVDISRNIGVSGNICVSGNADFSGNIATNNIYASGKIYQNNYILIPAGTVIQSAATTIPNGWLLCNGQQLNKNIYADLFNAIGYTYGGSSNNFNIPNIQGLTVIGTGGGYTLGSTGGETTHTLTSSEMPNHTHSLSRSSNPDSGAYDPGDGHAYNSSASTTDRYIVGSFNTNSTGGGNAHNNMQPYIVLNYLIKI